MQNEFAGPVHGSELAQLVLVRYWDFWGHLNQQRSLGEFSFSCTPAEEGREAVGRVRAAGAGRSPHVPWWQWGSSPARGKALLLPGWAGGPGVQSSRLGGGLCARGLKAALPDFTLHGRYTLTELSFYLQTEQLYWKRFSKHGTAQCYVY